MKVMKRWAPNNISKVNRVRVGLELIYVLLSSHFPVGLSNEPACKMLSADSIKNTLIYPYNKNKFKTLIQGFGNVVKLSSVS